MVRAFTISELYKSYPSKIRAIRNFLSSSCGAVKKNFIEDKFNVIVDRPVYPWPNREFVASLYLFTRNSISSSFCELSPDQRNLVRKYQSLYGFLKARNKLERYLKRIDVAVSIRPSRMKFVALDCEYNYCRSYQFKQSDMSNISSSQISNMELKKFFKVLDKDLAHQYTAQLTASEKKPVKYIFIPFENCFYHDHDGEQFSKYNGKYYHLRCDYQGRPEQLYEVPAPPSFSRFKRDEYSRLLVMHQEQIAKSNQIIHTKNFMKQQGFDPDRKKLSPKQKVKQQLLLESIPPLIIDSSAIQDNRKYEDPEQSRRYVDIRKKYHRRWVEGIRSRRTMYRCFRFAVGPYYDIEYS